MSQLPLYRVKIRPRNAAGSVVVGYFELIGRFPTTVITVPSGVWVISGYQTQDVIALSNHGDKIFGANFVAG